MNERGAGRPRFTWAGEGRPPGRGGREPLTREQIVGAAIRLADRDGLDALSMRRLGQELGAGATSLYWHVRNKDELLDLVLDEVIGEVVDEVRAELGPDAELAPGEWRRALELVARATRRVLVRHRHVASVMGERPTFGPKALDAIEWLLGIMRRAGFDDRPAFLATNALVNWAASWAVFEVRDPVGAKASDAEREAFLAEIAAFLGSLPVERYPNVVATIHLGFEISPDEQFEYGLGRLLDGIARNHVGTGSGP
jgi:AcrR family transcriptional regulator